MKKCKIENCIHKPIQIKRGYCTNHYYAYRKYGDPLHRSRAHDGSLTPKYLYKIWLHIYDRCYNTNNKQYADYGKRGITVCDRWNKDVSGWKAFDNFKTDVGERPAGKRASGRPVYTLDRIDNSSGYSPDNVRWATYNIQNSNTRKNNKDVGVVYDKSRGRWKARLTVNGVEVLHKRFATYEEAVNAREKASIDYTIVPRP